MRSIPCTGSARGVELTYDTRMTRHMTTTMAHERRRMMTDGETLNVGRTMTTTDCGTMTDSARMTATTDS